MNKAPLVLLLLYVGLDKTLATIGSDTAGFLFATSHFILMPLAAGGVILYMGLALGKNPSRQDLYKFACGLVIPISIIGLALTGSPILLKFLHISFNK